MSPLQDRPEVWKGMSERRGSGRGGSCQKKVDDKTGVKKNSTFGSPPDTSSWTRTHVRDEHRHRGPPRRENGIRREPEVVKQF